MDLGFLERVAVELAQEDDFLSFAQSIELLE
jgi:hypothetical protein